MDRYSRMVAIFKVLLPLAALAILSTLFLLSRTIDPTTTIPFADQEIEQRLREQQITAPRFLGTSPQGDEIRVSAAVAHPPQGDAPAEAEGLDAHITTASGVQIMLTSNRGTVDLAGNLVSFLGAVRLTTSTGYTVDTDVLLTAMDGVFVRTPGPVTGDAPAGEISAGRLTIQPKKPDGSVHMLFNQGVKLIYDPKQKE